jgi:putative transposase
MASALVKMILAQENRQAARAVAVKAVLTLRNRFSEAADVLENSIDDVLTFMDFPSDHWAQIRNTNVLERLNREIRRRSNVVGIFPNRGATLRLVGPLLQEIDEDGMVGNRAMSKSPMMKLRPPGEVNELTAESLLLK